MAKSKNNDTANIFKNDIPKMPEGYYSGDKPNPNLRKFVEDHIKENPYYPETDDYNVPAFDKPINTTKATTIYNMHTYWSKKPHDAIREYIKHYTKEGELVLDPFCGSGSTALAALLESRSAVAIDRSPAAIFITKNYCSSIDVNELQKIFEDLKVMIKPEIDWLYETKCDRCGGKAKISYTVYSQQFQCKRCMRIIPLYDCLVAESTTQKNKQKKISICPYCYVNGIMEEISSRMKKFGSIPVIVNYLCEAGCNPKRSERRYNDPNKKKKEFFDKYDLKKLKEIDNAVIPYTLPEVLFPKNFSRWNTDLKNANIQTVSELYTKRNLWALSSIKNFCDSINNRYSDVLLFALTAVSLALSKMQRYSPNSGFPNMVLSGTYYIPQIGREIEVLSWYEGKIKSLLNGYDYLTHLRSNKLLISCQSLSHNNDIPSSSIDYIFTDPPYSDNVQYGELNFVWEAWIGCDNNWHQEEIIINSVRGKSEEDWTKSMKQVMSECYRILKPGRWLSLCYHDSSEGTWSLVQDIMAEVGFIADKSDSALFIDTKQKTFNQLTADKVTKRDLVINFRKLKPGEIKSDVVISGTEDSKTFNEKVHSIIRIYLAEHSGTTKDRIYDEVVSKMVRKGEMEAHNFDELLNQVAELATDDKTRWYLKESEEIIIDEAETKKEDLSAIKIEEYLKQELTIHPEKEGLHYSDIFEYYVFSVKDKPRRSLQVLLLEYFYKTIDGTYRLPASDEEKTLKEKSRSSGVNRSIRRFVNYLEHAVPVPAREQPNDSTLADWIRHCKRTGLYDYGKYLYEKGGINLDNLTEKLMVDVEEDYQVCLKSLAMKDNKKK